MCPMEQTQSATAKHQRVFHPFLFAVFPVLSLFATHADRIMARVVWLPLVAMACISGALWILLWPILRQRQKRGFAISVLLLAFYSYGPVVDHVRRSMGGHLTISNAALGTAELSLLLAIIGGFFLLRRSKRSFERVTDFLNATAFCAVLIALGPLCLKLWPAVLPVHQEQSTEPSGSTEAVGARLPDIYYIILDAYAREDILRDVFNYDNTEFVSFLKERGFYVAGHSYSNYAWTLFSLSSSLNLDYLSSGVPPDEMQRDFDQRVQRQFQHNKVVGLLREHGYKCISFTSGYAEVDEMDIDATLKPGLVLSEFQNRIISMTPLRTVLGRTEYLSQYSMHRKRILYTLDQLPNLRHYGHPLFAFAHVTMPHPPFVLDENGRPVQAQRPFILTDGLAFFASGVTPSEYVSGYTKQVTYVSKRMMKIIDQIIRDTPDAVILLQADHGSRFRLTERLETTDVREAMGILNAYRLPGRDAQRLLYERISPVNSFRVVFNAYFGTDYPMLEDRSYSSDASLGWRRVDITQRLK